MLHYEALGLLHIMAIISAVCFALSGARFRKTLVVLG